MVVNFVCIVKMKRNLENSSNIVDEGSLKVLESLKEKNIFQVFYEFPK